MMLIELRGAQEEQYASSLAKKVDCTYSHIVKILNEMQKADLITFQKEGRLKVLKLTKKGEDVANAIEHVRSTL